MMKQELTMKQICPESYERAKVKAALVPHLSLVCVLFILALLLAFAHHPHADMRAGEQGREYL